MIAFFVKAGQILTFCYRGIGSCAPLFILFANRRDPGAVLLYDSRPG